ncbi:MAG: N-acetylgalactosamine-4-sulfatase [Anaerolineales bacterium]|nr:MAG: N-acetylgalactosamine-4-sulfatase [Anaerolineales bacterium]
MVKHTEKRPNVVFVITDDQGYPPLGCHGHPFIQTPYLDAFHRESVRFGQFHTGTTCAPTRAGLMTGHYCNSTGVWHTIGGRSLLRRDEWSLATALAEVGYNTGIFGKWHLGDDYPYRPQDRGFQRVVVHGGGGISQQPDYWGNDYFNDTYMVDGDPMAFDGYCTDVFFREALAFIEENSENSFFCYISTNAPHAPWNVEPAYRDLYTGNTESENYARFLGMITNIDDNFGRLREKLRELELEDNTILIFMSDNGQTGVRGTEAAEMYNAGMRGLKGSPYDGGHRVPFLLRWPVAGLADGHTIKELTSYVDFMPTVRDLCGVDASGHHSFHGESLRPLLDGEIDGHWAERAIATDTQRVAHPVKWRLSCVMKDTWRLVNKLELYNLADDPGQQHNVAAQHPSLVTELQQAYEDWWNLCSTQNSEEIPISIGAEEQEIAVLRTHDIRNEQDHSTVWHQGQVRQGDPCHGWWEIMVEADGEYEFDLRRWPEEAGHRVRGSIEGEDVCFREDGIEPGMEFFYSGGVALDIDTAGLWVSGFPEQWAPVSPEDRGALIRMNLPAGPRHVRAQFASSSGFYSSAYYVYVRRVG